MKSSHFTAVPNTLRWTFNCSECAFPSHAQGPAVFFSRDLCARYFTCTRSGQAQFILFDDAGTLRQKLRLGQQLGVAAAFFQWPEISNIAPELFARS